MLTPDAAGVHVIAITPFDEAGGLDLASTDRMVEAFLAVTLARRFPNPLLADVLKSRAGVGLSSRLRRSPDLDH